MHSGGQPYGEDVHQKDDDQLLGEQREKGQLEGGRSRLFKALKEQTHDHVGVFRVAEEEVAEAGGAVQAVGVAQQAKIGGGSGEETPQAEACAEDVLLMFLSDVGQ